MAFSGVLGEVGDALEGALTWRQRFSIVCESGACGRDGPMCRRSDAAGVLNYFKTWKVLHALIVNASEEG